jgi:hypothetical protein
MLDWHRLHAPTLSSSKLRLKCYSGNSLAITGECVVPVKYNNHISNLKLIVVKEAHPPLLGQWIRLLHLDLNNLIRDRQPDTHHIHHVVNESKFVVGQLVWTLKYPHTHRPQWDNAFIIKPITSRLYKVRLSNGQVCKRHQNQLRPHHSSQSEPSTSSSSLSDLSIRQSSTTPITTHPTPSTPRYSQRNRHPPDRYTPS